MREPDPILPGEAAGIARSASQRLLAFASFGLAGLLSAGLPGRAEASPGIDGTRNLSMGNATRGSSTGTDAVLINPAGLSYAQQFEIEPVYQFNLQDRTHGLGVFISDSLNSPHVALGLGYVFTRGTPRIRYDDPMGERQSLDLTHFGHEVAGALSVTAVRNWLYIAIKPKWQYVSLRYLDEDNIAIDHRPKLNAFGLDAAVALNVLGWVRFAVVGYNLAGPSRPARGDSTTADEIEGITTAEQPNINTENLRRIADYPRSLGHGLAVFPTRSMNFSINLDATYDFTSYRAEHEKWTRTTVHGGAEYVVGPVPIRVGGWWDSRGPGRADDRGYVSAGLGFIRPAALGGIGVDIGAGFAQQVAGPVQGQLDTVISFNLGIRLQPDI